MPYLHVYGQPELPFSGRSPRSRHNSYKAAESQRFTRGTKKLAVLAYIREHRAVTDQGLVNGLTHLKIPLQSICSLRNALVSDGLVEAVGDAMGAYGRTVTLWGPSGQPTHTLPALAIESVGA